MLTTRASLFLSSLPPFPFFSRSRLLFFFPWRGILFSIICLCVFAGSDSPNFRFFFSTILYCFHPATPFFHISDPEKGSGSHLVPFFFHQIYLFGVSVPLPFFFLVPFRSETPLLNLPSSPHVRLDSNRTHMNFNFVPVGLSFLFFAFLAQSPSLCVPGGDFT